MCERTNVTANSNSLNCADEYRAQPGQRTIRNLLMLAELSLMLVFFFRSVSVLVSSCHMRNLQSLWTMHSICAVIVLANHVCDGNKLNAGRVVA